MTVVGGPRTLDYDAVLFSQAAGISYYNSRIVNSLVTDIKDLGLWGSDKMYAIYPFIGGTAQAHKLNLLNPTDSNSAFRLGFTGSWTHDSMGITGDGSTAYADTYFVPTTYFSGSKYGSVGTYTGTAPTDTNMVSIGAVSEAPPNNLASTYFSIKCSHTVNIQRVEYLAGGGPYGSGANFYIYNATSSYLGFNAVLRESRTSRIAFHNNGTYYQNTDTIQENSPRVSLYVGAERVEGGSPQFFSDQTISFAFIGGVLTTQEMQDFKSAIDAYQLKLNRKVI